MEKVLVEISVEAEGITQAMIREIIEVALEHSSAREAVGEAIANMLPLRIVESGSWEWTWYVLPEGY